MGRRKPKKPKPKPKHPEPHQSSCCRFPVRGMGSNQGKAATVLPWGALSYSFRLLLHFCLRRCSPKKLQQLECGWVKTANCTRPVAPLPHISVVLSAPWSQLEERSVRCFTMSLNAVPRIYNLILFAISITKKAPGMVLPPRISLYSCTFSCLANVQCCVASTGTRWEAL